VTKGENIAFEFRQMNGAVSFLKVRRATPGGSKTFWIEPAGAGLSFWNEPCLSDPSDTLIVTEGEIDALSFLAIGESHVVSVPNGAPPRAGEGTIYPDEDRQFAYLWAGNKLRPELQGYRRIILATDSDAAGGVLRNELAVHLGRTRCWYLDYGSDSKDGNEVLVKHGPDCLRAVLADAKPVVASQLVSFSEIPARADATRYSSGWAKLDQHFRVVPPQLIVVTGRPNAGKSQWVIALVANLARLHGLKGAILQFEDNPDRNRRDLIRYAKAWATGDEKWCIKEDPTDWVDRMFKTISPNENIEDDLDFDLAWLKNAIEEAATRHGCRWILIDPWNEIEHLWGDKTPRPPTSIAP
jgi:twinkle protein